MKFRTKLYLCEMVQRLQHDLGITVSESTVCRALSRLRLSRLKLTRIVAQKANPANMARYALFEQAQGALNTDAVVWLDETGLCDLDADRTHGRCVAAAVQLLAPRRSADTRLVGCSGDTGGVVTEVGLARNNRGHLISFIAALDTKGVLPVTFSPQARPPSSGRCACPAPRHRADAAGVQCSTNSFVFEAWFLLVLLPVLAVRHPAGCTIILDNASIHRPAVLRALLAGTNHLLMFLPAYSPEKNPVRLRLTSCVVRLCAHGAVPPRRLSCCFRG